MTAPPTKPGANDGNAKADDAKAGNVNAGMQIAVARRALAQAFRNGALDTPELDARVLAGHALGLDQTALVVAADRLLTAEGAERINAVAARRLAHEPVARIVGRREFWGLPLRLSAATLVPRPETETIVEAALAIIDDNGSRDRTLRIADLGTGTGALLLALLSELPHATGIGSDLDPDAIATAQANATELGLSDRVAFVLRDFGRPPEETFDLVVSNPPYIATRDIDALAPEVREHDPRLALDGGTDGFVAYRTLATHADAMLRRNGHFVVELGVGQAETVAGIFSAAGLVPLPPRPDLSGIPRALPIRRAT